MSIEDLSAPFDPRDLEWRQQGKPSSKGSALLLCYVNARAVMDRLDAAVGPTDWTDAYVAGPNGGVLCRLSIRDPAHDGRWITKEDAAENTDVDPVKGGISGALKRAAVKWGVGRYLYGLDAQWCPIVDGWLPSDAKGANIQSDRRHIGYAIAPRLPSWALPNGGAPVLSLHEQQIEACRKLSRELGATTGDEADAMVRAGSQDALGWSDVARVPGDCLAALRDYRERS